MYKGQTLSPRQPPEMLCYESVAGLTAPWEPQMHFTTFENSILVQKTDFSKTACINPCWCIYLIHISLISLISHKPHSSPWFSAVCAAAIVHRNHFFSLYPLHLNLNSYKLVIVVEELKQKRQSLPRNLTPGTFGELLILFWAMVNLLYLLYVTDLRCCLLLLLLLFVFSFDKAKLLKKTFLRTLTLMIQESLWLLFHLGLIWNYITYTQLPSY